jgi:hypothetical protein
MAEDDYSNRELDGKFDHISGALARIEAQTTKTNGRVTRLEKVALIAATGATVYFATSGGADVLDLLSMLL